MGLLPLSHLLFKRERKKEDEAQDGQCWQTRCMPLVLPCQERHWQRGTIMCAYGGRHNVSRLSASILCSCCNTSFLKLQLKASSSKIPCCSYYCSWTDAKLNWKSSRSLLIFIIVRWDALACKQPLQFTVLIKVCFLCVCVCVNILYYTISHNIQMHWIILKFSRLYYPKGNHQATLKIGEAKKKKRKPM